MAIFLSIIIGIGYVIGAYYENETIFYCAVFFSIFANIASYWYSDKIVLSLSGAKEARRQEYFDLYTIVENLSITAGLPMPKVFVIEDRAPNAFATGRDKNHATVCITSGLLKILNKSELEGVISHELSHIGNRDILLSTIVVTLVGSVSIIAHIFTRGLLFGSRERDERGGNVLQIIGIIFIMLSPIAATLIQLAISRKREFLADATGALLTRYTEGLASALQKIAHANIPMRNANQATAHLFIANPFGNLSEKVSTLFSTHPPVEERIKALLGK